MCGSDETHPYPVRSFTYRKEQVRSDEVQKVIVFITNLYSDLVCHRLPPTPCSRAPQYLLSEQLLRETGITLACPRSCTNLGPVGRQHDTLSPTPTLLITDNCLPLLDPYPNVNPSSAHKGRNVIAQKKHTLFHVAMETRILLSEWLNVFHINPLQPSGYYIYHLV